METDTTDKEEERDLIRKCNEYLDRAESIKEFLKTGKECDLNKSKKQSATTSSTISSTTSLESALAQSNPELEAQIKGSIVEAGTGVSMADVIGLDAVKKELDESIRLPMAFPRTMADRGMNNTLLLFGVSVKIILKIAEFNGYFL